MAPSPGYERVRVTDIARLERLVREAKGEERSIATANFRGL